MQEILQEKIPQAIKGLRRWITWKYMVRDGDRTKVPFCPWSTGDDRLVAASSTDPETWGEYTQAVEFARQHKAVDGIGFVLGDGWGGCDLDHCRDNETGAIAPWAAKIIGAVHSYTEVSPSGTGTKTLFKAALPQGHRCRTKNLPGFELYDWGRFFTVTGRHLESTPPTVEDRQAQVEKVYSIVFPPEEPQQKEPARKQRPEISLDDQDVIDMASRAENGDKFRALWKADEKKLVELGYKKADGSPDWSSCDQALVYILDWWTNSDTDQIERLWQASGLYRSKLQRRDYLDRTIKNATARQIKRYEPPDSTEEERVNKVVGGEKIPEPEKPKETDDEKCARLAAEAKKAEEKPPEKKPGRRGYLIKDLKKLPPIKWHIHRHWGIGGLGTMYGDSESGKSFQAIDQALCVATGKPYLGIYPVVQSPVCYIASEGYSGIKKRIDAWLLYYGMQAPENFVVIPEVFNLLAKEEAQAVLEIAHEQLGVLPQFLVIDTLARNFGDGDENATKDMSKYVRTLDLLGAMVFQATGIPATRVSLHHKGKDETKGARGAICLHNACDNVIEVNGSVESGVLVKYKKSKDAAKDETYPLTRHLVSLADDEEGSLVLLRASEWDTVLRNLNLDQRTMYRQLADKFGSVRFTRKQAIDHHLAMDAERKKLYALAHGTEVEKTVHESTAGDRLKRLLDVRLILKDTEGYYTANPAAAMLR